MRLATIYRRRPLIEATMEWLGPIHIQLGNGNPNTLNWGTGSPDRPPFLYVPVDLGHIRAILKYLEDATAWYDTLRRLGGIGGSQVNYPDYFEVIPKIGRRMRHLGEAHITVAMGDDCVQLSRQRLQQLGLFDKGGNGIDVPITHTGKFKVFRAPYYKDRSDPEGPLLVAEEIDVPLLQGIRGRIGAGPLPGHYLPHITIGYAAVQNRVHRSFVARHGSQRRAREQF